MGIREGGVFKRGGSCELSSSSLDSEKSGKSVKNSTSSSSSFDGSFFVRYNDVVEA